VVFVGVMQVAVVQIVDVPVVVDLGMSAARSVTVIVSMRGVLGGCLFGSHDEILAVSTSGRNVDPGHRRRGFEGGFAHSSPPMEKSHRPRCSDVVVATMAKGHSRTLTGTGPADRSASVGR